METGFKGYHPVVNLIFFGSVIVFGMVFKHPLTLAVCFASSVVYYFKLCKKTAVKSLFAFVLPMLLAVIIINGLFSHYGLTQLFALPGGSFVTLESVIYGFVLGLMTVTVIIWFFCYNEIVTTDKLMFVFGRMLPSAALVISMALRFLPMYKNRLKAITAAQRGIGIDYKTGSLLQRIKTSGKIISALLTRSLENAVETSDSMRARGYGVKGTKNYGKFRWSTKDVIAVVTILLLDGILTAGCASNALYCVYTPGIIVNPPANFGKVHIISQLNLTVNPVSVPGFIAFSAFTALSFLPVFIDIKEDIKWNRLKSKI